MIQNIDRPYLDMGQKIWTDALASQLQPVTLSSRTRWRGSPAHFIYILYGSITNLFVSGQKELVDVLASELQPVAANLSSTRRVGYEASKCIDGRTDFSDDWRLKNPDLCHTKDEPTPWLAIDYGKNVTVERVELFNRHHCCGERTRNVDIRVSDELPTSGSQMFSGGTLLGHFAGPGSDGQHIVITGFKQ